ncbi:hypothetical protein D3C87_1599430 [compost metagenome]
MSPLSRSRQGGKFLCKLSGFCRFVFGGSLCFCFKRSKFVAIGRNRLAHRLRGRAAEAAAHGDKVLGRDDLPKLFLIDSGLASCQFLERLAERLVTVVRQVALQRDNAFGDGCGNFMGLAE